MDSITSFENCILSVLKIQYDLRKPEEKKGILKKFRIHAEAKWSSLSSESPPSIIRAPFFAYVWQGKRSLHFFILSCLTQWTSQIMKVGRNSSRAQFTHVNCRVFNKWRHSMALYHFSMYTSLTWYNNDQPCGTEVEPGYKNGGNKYYCSLAFQDGSSLWSKGKKVGI